MNHPQPAADPTAASAAPSPQTASAGDAAPDTLAAFVAEAASENAARIAELEAKNLELADSYLRAKAEADNTRRRADEEIAKSRKFAVESFAESLLPVKDSLELAIATHASGQGSPEQLIEGVHATLRQLGQALERNKVQEVNPPAGTKFDPHQHQAISMVPAEQEANTVVAVLQKGYTIAERVLRPALVTVAAPK
ncbi:MAG TPA: nucleotide exchange factor GrpE [Burkholderiaceae bacterium]|nr:nucleotide exchange factor GrpE [Burkholderiaceae bacterium]HMX11529.1 nucleotide exchange factor GrpE [Burkholderiaceae bacterium]HMZ01648.1 nucleotide exchange factor GrpE [Burkholderiaceae bacterium]HNB46160.1 nucleotide exchange factor GrpE [Burkholderiaceae bacterium]HNG80580.1 nucleotide exchange factor GrpE [Burkholderiaceae bacterium]